MTINPLAPKSDQHLFSPFRQYHCLIKQKGYENTGKDHQIKDTLIVKQILLISVIQNVWRTIQRLCMHANFGVQRVTYGQVVDWLTSGSPHLEVWVQDLPSYIYFFR